MPAPLAHIEGGDQLANGVDALIRFTPMSRSAMREVVTDALERLRRDLSCQQIGLSASKGAVRFVADRLVDQGDGVAPLARLLRDRVLMPAIKLARAVPDSRAELTVAVRKGRIEVEHVAQQHGLPSHARRDDRSLDARDGRMAEVLTVTETQTGRQPQ